jgi:F0F1-type ATP synthase assembly protein I
MSDQRPSGGMHGFTRQFALVMELPFIFVGSVVMGGLFGYLLDRWLNTSPAFLLILGAVGFVAGLRELTRRLNDVRRTGPRKNGGNSSGEPPAAN